MVAALMIAIRMLSKIAFATKPNIPESKLRKTPKTINIVADSKSERSAKNE